MSNQGLGHNFKTSPSGLLVPSSVWNPTLHAADITIEMVGPADTTKYLRGDNPPTWVAPQIDTIGAGTDIATNNVSTTKHGLTPKLPNDATKYLDGTGAYTVPPAGSPSGAAGGALAGTYPNPSLAGVITAGGPVGSSTTVPVLTYNAAGQLTVVSSATISPSPGSGGALTLIADSLLGADAASFDFTSIAGTYTQLMLVCYLRSARVATSDGVTMRFNNLSTGIYYDEEGRALAATASANENIGGSSANTGRCPADSATALRFGALHILIPNYANATNHKSWVADATAPDGTLTNTVFRTMNGGTVEVTAAVSRVTLIPSTGANFRAGSRATLYGMG